MADEANKPCLVQAGQGFSVLYKGRALYSRYAPEKAVLQMVENLELLPGTLLVCVSPCLWYGMRELLAKLPADSHILALEADESLYELAVSSLAAQPFAGDGRLHLLGPDMLCGAGMTPAQTAAYLVHFGGKRDRSPLPPAHTFRRALLVELSGGSALCRQVYTEAAGAAEDAIATFWKNRLTLTRFGRLYARNLFKNLAHTSASLPLSTLFASIMKPIMLFGAGESAEATVRTLSPSARPRIFVIAVDAALPVLRGHGITPDCVVAVESQLAIEKAYIGNPRTAPLLLCDLVSRPAVTAHHAEGGSIRFFLSAYTEAQYLSELRRKGLLPPEVPPLGSVGLTATCLALRLRASSEVPVFVTGLDFSYSPGTTHARGAPAHTARLVKVTRLHPTPNADAAFKTGASPVPGKQGAVITDRALSGYAAQFAATFSGTQQLFDVGESGIPLGIPRIENAEINAWLAACTENSRIKAQAGRLSPAPVPGQDDAAVRAWLREEHEALTRLKTLLVHGEAARADNMSVQEEIAALLTPRDYLYLHFPDGYACRADDVGFLKRVRSEIDFFLKDIDAVSYERNANLSPSLP